MAYMAFWNRQMNDGEECALQRWRRVWTLPGSILQTLLLYPTPAGRPARGKLDCIYDASGSMSPESGVMEYQSGDDTSLGCNEPDLACSSKNLTHVQGLFFAF